MTRRRNGEAPGALAGLCRVGGSSAMRYPGLMHGGVRAAASAGYRVGYESPSQFSREYSRLFGAPPSRDVARLRSRMGSKSLMG